MWGKCFSFSGSVYSELSLSQNRERPGNFFKIEKAEIEKGSENLKKNVFWKKDNSQKLQI